MLKLRCCNGGVACYGGARQAVSLGTTHMPCGPDRCTSLPVQPLRGVIAFNYARSHHDSWGYGPCRYKRLVTSAAKGMRLNAVMLTEKPCEISSPRERHLPSRASSTLETAGSPASNYPVSSDTFAPTSSSL